MRHEIGSNTLWVFVSCSHEPRHLFDIVFSITMLKTKGVRVENILVFVDHPAAKTHFQPYGILNIYAISDLGAELISHGAYKNVVAVVGGHGDVVGLRPSSSNIVTPTALVTAVRTVPNITLGVIVLTQCYAGVFNFLDASNSPPLVVVGGTNLNPSVSLNLRLKAPIMMIDGSPGLQEWGCNIFAYFLFLWLSSPTDVDGDGQINLIDAYKFAGSLSNRELRTAKSVLFSRAQHLMDRLKEVKASSKDASEKKLELDAIGLELREVLDMLYLHQEPWILHAHLARDVYFTWI